MLSLITGCTQPAPRPVTQEASFAYPVGIWYEIESDAAADPESADRRIEADMDAISRLGLNTVFAGNCAAEHHEAVAGAAERHGIQQVVWEIPANPVRPIMNLRCDTLPGEDAPRMIGRWWRRFHSGLAQGHTGGLAIDHRRAAPATQVALASTRPSVVTTRPTTSPSTQPALFASVERLAAIKRLASRMKAWGPILDRLEIKPYQETKLNDAQIRVAIFARDERRVLLVMNSSESRWLRTAFIVPDPVDGRPAERVVEVPAEADLTLGAVTHASRGRISVPLELAPGEAKLFEVFGPVSDTIP